jgi:beta-galactosidase/beta-glucuronidase
MTDRHAYPRPMMERADWTNLNGWWEFAMDRDAAWSSPDQVQWTSRILVPYSPETKLSGIHDTSFYRAVWYRRDVSVPDLSPQSPGEAGRRLILHFGAVDFNATVWVNGLLASRHDGGYTPFSVDISELIDERGHALIVVRAEDDPHDLTKPRGKQDWQLEPHSIWYPRTTGIWQTVWMERVNATHLRYVRWTPVVERWEIGFETRLDGIKRNDLRLHVRLEANGNVLADDIYSISADEVHRRIALSDPGIDDSRNELLWSPGSPILIRAHIRLIDAHGSLVDEVRSYSALRSITIQGDRFVLNGRPYPLQMVLDQGYFPESGITAPDDNALRRDVELAKAMGFNGVRKHQKIEDPRYLYWADTLGLMVWEEMPSAYRFSRTSIDRLTEEWKDVIRRDVSHPCIVAWVPFNESWGVPDLPESPAQRHYVQALYHLTKTLDPSRPIIGNDGWESVATDIIGIHDYDDNPRRIERRYGKDEMSSTLFKRERPGGRLLILGEHAHAGLPVMLTEFGGIAYSENVDSTWGYARVESAEELANHYCDLVTTVRYLPLAGFCYTQFADTYQEANGLLYADRTPKFALKQMALATRGPRNRLEKHMEAAWRERLMNYSRQLHTEPMDDHQTRTEA